MTYVSVTEFGAKGDGVTDDSDAVQAAIDGGSVIEFPDVAAFYLIRKTLWIGGTGRVGGKSLIGRRNCRGGFGAPLIQGSGGFPLMRTTGTNVQNRSIELISISAIQTAEAVLQADFAAWLNIDGCRLQSNANKGATVELMNSTSVTVNESMLLCSGGGFALTAYSQCNVLRIHGNQITGGDVGGACHIEQCANVSYHDNRTEVGIYGLVIGSGCRLDNPSAGKVIGAGACHGVSVINNYFENVQNAIVIATDMRKFQNTPTNTSQAVFAVVVQGNTASVTTLDNALITYGRIDAGSIQFNSLWRKAGGSAPAIRQTLATMIMTAPKISDNHIDNGTGPVIGP